MVTLALPPAEPVTPAVHGPRRGELGSLLRLLARTLALGVVVALALFAHSAAAFVVLYAVAGVLEGPVNLARSLHLQAILPAHRRATGFSLQYAAIGWGFAAGGLLSTQLVGHLSPQVILAVTGATVAAAALLALISSRQTVTDP